ncbi:ROK family transcriptional regulator [Saccharothrix texasensis]|uniref:Putative NBD/HSP70 family sugar kinase n=1 Tax=Saccharothrix texasensis TaxID=103734 RepID=A0A3N1HH31_9PSEU|nr:ROK family transcriptional regulator [Saccharothrix texasensis]ROP41761.1 putative NBD/HSP70 family sugar kinase [Saccharothrix texasensis]
MTSPPRAGTTSPWPDLPEAARDVLLDVLIHGPGPRVEIALRLRLSRATLTRAARALVAHGLLVEGGTERRSSTGRPSEILHVRGEAHRFLGVKLTADRCYATVTDLTATPSEAVEQPLRSTDPDEVVTQIAAIAADRPGLTGIGITLGGVVRGGVVADAGFLGWRDVPLASAVTEATGLPVTVDNDVQALTSAEHWFGAGAGVDSMVLITIGAGVGVGLVVDGGLVQGAHGLPPRFAHLLVDPGGPQCGYGHRGCASSYLMSHVILRRLDGCATYDEAVERARAGDPDAGRVFAEAGYALGVLIGHAANFIDPAKILLTGDGLPLYEIASGQVRAGIGNTYEDDPALIDLDVRPFDFGEWARAAAALAIKAAITGAA